MHLSYYKSSSPLIPFLGFEMHSNAPAPFRFAGRPSWCLNGLGGLKCGLEIRGDDGASFFFWKEAHTLILYYSQIPWLNWAALYSSRESGVTSEKAVLNWEPAVKHIDFLPIKVLKFVKEWKSVWFWTRYGILIVMVGWFYYRFDIMRLLKYL